MDHGHWYHFKPVYINEVNFGEDTESLKIKRDVLLHVIQGKDRVTDLHSLRERLSRLDVFSSLTVQASPAYIDLEEAKQARAIPVNLTLSSCKEKSRLQAKFAANVGSSGEGPEINNSLKLLNVFGRLESLNITRQGQGDEKHLLATFHKPLLFEEGDKSLKLSGNWGPKSNLGSNYSESSMGATASYIDGPHRFSYNLEKRNIEPKKFATEGVLIESGDNIKSSVSHGWSYDKRNNRQFPTGGHKDTELAGLGGDAYHIRHTGTFTTYLPLFYPHLNLALGLSYGVNLPLRQNKTFISDRFFLGNVTQIRGFRSGGMGPRTVATHNLPRQHQKQKYAGDMIGGDAYYVASASVNQLLFRGEGLKFGTHLYTQACNSTSLRNKSLSNIKEVVDTQSTRLVSGIGLSAAFSGLRVELNYNYHWKTVPTDQLNTIELGFTLDM